MLKTLKLKYLILLAILTPTILGSVVALMIFEGNAATLRGAVLGGAVVWIVAASVCAAVVSSRVGRLISASVDCVASTATEIAGTVDQRERLASQQAAAATETTAAMEELAASARQSAEQAEDLAVGARNVVNLAEDGTRSVELTLKQMDSLRGKVHTIAERILQLSEHTSQIGTITNLVTDVASRTNMLALNAAVEAARAGDQGKGFSVVAVEIRKLADQTKRSAERINVLVADILKAINSTVMATEEGTKTVDEGAVTANRTVESFLGVRDAISKASENTQQISLNAKQQSLAVNEVLRAMSELTGDSKATAASLGLGRSRAAKLQESAGALRAIL
jgi:methyl-accepting chemotaxis protein